MNKAAAQSIERAEKRVAQARAQALAQYRVWENKLRRGAASRLFIGGVLLSAIALAYFGIGRFGKAKPLAKATRGSGWPQVLQTAQLLLPLASAVKAARKTESRATHSPAPKPGKE